MEGAGDVALLWLWPGDPTEGTFLGIGDLDNGQFDLWAVKSESVPPPGQLCFLLPFSLKRMYWV